jgi:hypothetical protein
VGLSLLLLALAAERAAADVLPSTKWVNFYGSDSTLNGVALPAGTYVAVYDPSGTQCGEFLVQDAGWYGLMACYGDESFTPEDEGALSGEPLVFRVAGQAATAVPVSQNDAAVSPDTIVTWSGHHDLWQVELHAPAIVGPTLSIAPAGAAVQLSWPHSLAEVAAYEVWRSRQPHFLLGQRDSRKVVKLDAQPGVMTWIDDEHEADPEANYYYRVRGLNADSEPWCTSDPVVGEFNYALVAGSG